MKELNIGGQQVRVKATALTLLYYKQAFRTDLMSDLMKMRGLEDNPEQFESVACLQLVWAMAKSGAYGKPFPGFEEWLNSFDSIDFSDPTFLLAALEEATDGLFRGQRGKKG